MPGSRTPATLRQRRTCWTEVCEHGDPRDPSTLTRYLNANAHLAAATRLRYLSHVEVACVRLFGPRPPREAAAVEDVRGILRREKLVVTQRQAPPAGARDVLSVFALNPGVLGTVAVVQFATASRFGDLQTVEAADVVLEDDTVLITLRRTKTALSTGTRTVIGCLPPSTLTAVRALLTRRLPFQCDYRKYVALLKRARSDLTAHSLRRGAIQAALRHTTDAKVMRLTGHQSMDAFARYAGVLPQVWKEEMVEAATAIWS